MAVRAGVSVRVVQTYVSQLRKVLEPDLARGSPPQLVIRAEPGYRLVVNPETLDATRFEPLFTEGRMGLSSGGVRVAAQRLRAGLELWRGPALADVADVPALRAEALRLNCLPDLAVEERIEADIELGRHGELVGELETLVSELARLEHGILVHAPQLTWSPLASAKDPPRTCRNGHSQRYGLNRVNVGVAGLAATTARARR